MWWDVVPVWSSVVTTWSATVELSLSAVPICGAKLEDQKNLLTSGPDEKAETNGYSCTSMQLME